MNADLCYLQLVILLKLSTSSHTLASHLLWCSPTSVLPTVLPRLPSASHPSLLSTSPRSSRLLFQLLWLVFWVSTVLSLQLLLDLRLRPPLKTIIPCQRVMATNILVLVLLAVLVHLLLVSPLVLLATPV